MIMSRNTSVDIVSFVSKDACSTNEQATGFLVDGFYDRFKQGDFNPVYNGWTFDGEAIQIGRNRKIYANSWIKDGLEVFIFDESPFRHCGGPFSPVLVSDTRKGIEQFMRDMGMSGSVLVDVVVQQTI